MNIQKVVFKFYLFAMPFMAFPGVAQLRRAIAPNSPISNSLILLMIGLCLFAIFQNGKFPYSKDALVTKGVFLCLKLNLLCFVTSLALFIPFGPLNGENTLRASFPSIVFMFVNAAAFYYNAVMFRIVTREEIERVLNWLIVVVLGVGVLQLAVLKVPGMALVYDLLNFADILVDSSYLRAGGRICFTGSEPAAAGGIVAVFLLPYTFSKVLTTRYFKYKLYALLFIMLSFFTYSSTVYIGILISTGLFGYFYIRQHITDKLILQFVSFCAFLGLLVIFCGPYVWQNTSIGSKMEDLLFKKTASQENLSTLVRYSTIRADWRAFLHYPLTGVGNGNQGYFYNSEVEKAVSWQALHYSEFARKLDGSAGIVSGGAFVPAFISGYGIVGVLLLVSFLKKCVQQVRQHPQEYGCFRYVYYIGGIVFLCIATVSIGFDGNCAVLFMASIPFMVPTHKEKL